MIASRSRTGQTGEEIAGHYVVRAGWSVVERNFRCRHGEIDLVARDGDELVFVEVRTRRGAAFGTPEESITEAKQRRMAACALAYVQERGVRTGWRVDLIAIELRGEQVKRLDHYRHVLQ